MLIRIRLTFNRAPTYKDMRVNDPLCQVYVDEMEAQGEKVILKLNEYSTASTDMGKLAPAWTDFEL